MTKQEQINEMYNTLRHKGLIEFDKENAEALYNAGYRKVGEEYEYIKGYLLYTKQLKEQVRKETAKEILQTLYNNNERPQFMEVYIKTLADKYGVEVEND